MRNADRQDITGVLVSIDTLKRDWRMAGAWLLGELTGKQNRAGS
ncbi:MAG TPA: hypothetical protein VLS25_13825 [Dehalococcoidia bacterium]|nr:hypothetical protein [Dehalococcoidia bacterium]